MSIKVFERLRKMLMEATREERLEIDEEIEKKTGKYCDEGVDDLSDIEFVEIVNKVKKKRKKRGKKVKEVGEAKEQGKEVEEVEKAKKIEVEVYA